jgi:hypothetical protein
LLEIIDVSDHFAIFIELSHWVLTCVNIINQKSPLVSVFFHDSFSNVKGEFFSFISQYIQEGPLIHFSESVVDVAKQLYFHELQVELEADFGLNLKLFIVVESRPLWEKSVFAEFLHVALC